MRWALGVLALFAAVIVALEFVGADYRCKVVISTQDVCDIHFSDHDLDVTPESATLEVNNCYDAFRLNFDRVASRGGFTATPTLVGNSWNATIQSGSKFLIIPRDGGLGCDRDKQHQPAHCATFDPPADWDEETPINWEREASEFWVRWYRDGAVVEERQYFICDNGDCQADGTDDVKSQVVPTQHRDQTPAQVQTPDPELAATQTAVATDDAPDDSLTVYIQSAEEKRLVEIRERIVILELELADLEIELNALLAKVEPEPEPEPEPDPEPDPDPVTPAVANDGVYRFMSTDIIWHDNGTFTFTKESLAARENSRYCYDQSVVDAMPENAHPYLREVVESEICS